MKKLFPAALFFLLLLPEPVYALAAEYFDTFYTDYLYTRKIPENNREVLNLLYKISNKKVNMLEESLKQTNDRFEIEEIIALINEEYFDFLENLNFELSYALNTNIKKRTSKKFKRAHKKFMRRLKCCYL